MAQLLDVDERDFVVTVLAEFRLDPDVTLLMDSLEACVCLLLYFLGFSAIH